MRTASILTAGLFVFSSVLMAQDNVPDSSSLFTKGKYNLEVGVGAAAYQGDLTEKKTLFGQASYAASLGSSYNLSNKLSLGLEFSYMKLKADDKKNDKPALKARNLSFESKVWDINLTLQFAPFTFGKLTPYVDGGLGLFHFNPTTIDRYGTRQSLASLGTEGQGMANPNNPFYVQTQVQIPFGIGVQYALNKRMAVKVDFRFRKTFTDYIDDVSTVYPNGELIDKKLPIIKQLSFRGDEIDPNAKYPSGAQRGNSDNKDFYYTGQLKFVCQLNKKLL